jgi:hypothetical protein
MKLKIKDALISYENNGFNIFVNKNLHVNADLNQLLEQIKIRKEIYASFVDDRCKSMDKLCEILTKKLKKEMSDK